MIHSFRHFERDMTILIGDETLNYRAREDIFSSRRAVGVVAVVAASSKSIFETHTPISFGVEAVDGPGSVHEKCA